MEADVATPAAPSPARHGEGPTWDADQGELLWVDLTEGLVRRAAVSPRGELVERAAPIRGGDTVGAVVPVAAGGWLLAADSGFTHVTEGGTPRLLLDVADQGTRMNDAACDRMGRFFAGTMAFDERPGAGTLYRLDLDGTVTTVLDGLTISNGIGWAPDDRTVYLADSGQALVWAFDYDLAGGTVSGQRVLLDLSLQEGVADGLTVDDEGCLWTAIWGGGQVRRWTPDGELLAVVNVPVLNTTSCAFAGPDRDLLVISTSAEGLDEQQRLGQPDAGRLFTVRPGVRGPAAFPYRGRLSGLAQIP